MSSDLEPVYDPATGRNVYELKDPSGGSRRLALIPHTSVIPRLGDTMSVDEVNRRALMLYNEYGQEKATLLGGFALDLAASSLDDSELLRLSKQRLALLDPARPWWMNVLHRVGGGLATGIAGGAAGFLVGGPVGAAIGFGAGAIAGGVNPDLANWAKDHTTDAFARAVTGDQSASIGGLLALSLPNRPGWDAEAAQDYWDKPADQRNMAEEIKASGSATKMAAMVFDIFGDPLTYVGGVRSLGTAGATIGKGAVGAGSGRIFKARTSLEDYERILRGELKVSDVARSKSMIEIARSMLRGPRADGLVRRIALAKSPDQIARVFARSSHVTDDGIALLWHAAQKGEDEVRNTLVRLADPAEALRLEPELVRLQGEIGAFTEARAFAREMADLAEKRGITNSAFRKRESLLDEALERTELQLRRVRMEQRAAASIERVPETTFLPQMKAWYDESSWAQQAGIWQTAGFREINSALRAVGRPIGRSLRGVFSMNPRATLRVEEPFENTQILRWAREYELDSQKLAANIRKPWTPEDSDEFYRGWVALADADDVAKTEFVVETQKRYLMDNVGLSEEQYAALTDSWRKSFNQFVTHVRKGKKGSPQVETDPIWSSDLQNQITLLDPMTVRRVSRWGQQAFSNPAAFTKALTETMDGLQRIWKTQAVLRPAWAFRVVMLSEQPRLAIAGMPNFVTHPVVALAAADLFRTGKVFEGAAGQKLKGLLDELGEHDWVPGEELGLATAIEASGIARHLSREAAGSLKPRGMGKTGDIPEFYSWKHMVDARDRKLYKRGWLKILNGSLANDPVARRISLLWPQVKHLSAKARNQRIRDELVRFMREEPLGNEWASKMNIDLTSDTAVELAARKRLRVFLEQTNKHDALIENVGRVRAADVADLDPPELLPSWVWADEMARPGTARTDQLLAKTVNHAFDKFSAKPSFALSRRGPMSFEMVSQLQRMARLAAEKGEHIDVERLVAAAKSESVDLTAAERALLKTARDNAAAKVKQVVYDLSESSRTADLARFIAPFGNAWQEEITRWAMLTYSRPHIPIVFAEMWRERRSQPITFPDPVSGIEYMMVPFGESIVKGGVEGWNLLTGAEAEIELPLLYPWDSVNMVTGHGLLPGGGPWIDVAVNFLRDRKVSWSDSLRVLSPFAGQKSFMDIAFNSPVVRELKNMSAEESDKRMGMLFKAVLAYQLDKHQGDFSKVDIDEAEEQVRALQFVNSTARILAGGGINVSLPPGLRTMISYAQWLNREFDEDIADQLLLERYGVEASLWVQALTKTSTGQPPTKEAEAFLLNEETRPLAEKYGRVFWSLMGERVQGDYDPLVADAQIQRGERDPFPGGKSFWEAAQVNIAWYRYSQLATAKEAALAKLGLPFNSQSQLATPVREWFDGELQKLYTAYPPFKEQHLAHRDEREYKRLENIRLLRELAADPSTEDLQSAQGAREYFSLRDTVRQVAERSGFKTLDSQESRWLRQRWVAGVAEILNRYPEFRQVWGRLRLEFDPVVRDE